MPCFRTPPGCATRGAALPACRPPSRTRRRSLGELVARYARTHTPFLADLARDLGIGTAVAHDALRRLLHRPSHRRRVPPMGRDGVLRCEVLRLIWRRSLAGLRAEVEPVPTAQYARFLPTWLGHPWTPARHRWRPRPSNNPGAIVPGERGRVADPAGPSQRLPAGRPRRIMSRPARSAGRATAACRATMAGSRPTFPRVRR